MSKSRKIELLEKDNEDRCAQIVDLTSRLDVAVCAGRASVKAHEDMTKARDTVSGWLADRDTEVLKLKAQLERGDHFHAALLKAHQAMESDLGNVREKIGSERFDELTGGIGMVVVRDARVPYLTIETRGATDNVDVTVAEEPFVGVTPASEREPVDVKAIVEGIKSRYKHGDRIDGGPVCLDARYVREPGKVLVWEYLVRVWLGRFTIIRKGCPVVLGADGQTLYITPDDRAEPWGVVVEGWSASDSLTEGELWVRRVAE